MKGYGLARTAYRCADRVVLRHLPPAAEHRARTTVLRVARRWFGPRIKAGSAADLTADSRRRNTTERLPAWAERELSELAALEPAVGQLLGDGARLEPYFIPCDKVELGHAYALARRQLQPTYASMLATGAAGRSRVAAALARVSRPTVIVDVDADPALRALAASQGIDYLALARAGFDANDRAALFARLVLQLHPGRLRYARDAFLDACLARHGLALASIAEIAELPDRDLPAAVTGQTG